MRKVVHAYIVFFDRCAAIKRISTVVIRPLTQQWNLVSLSSNLSEYERGAMKNNKATHWCSDWNLTRNCASCCFKGKSIVIISMNWSLTAIVSEVSDHFVRTLLSCNNITVMLFTIVANSNWLSFYNIEWSWNTWSDLCDFIDFQTKTECMGMKFHPW